MRENTTYIFSQLQKPTAIQAFEIRQAVHVLLCDHSGLRDVARGDDRVAAAVGVAGQEGAPEAKGAVTGTNVSSITVCICLIEKMLKNSVCICKKSFKCDKAKF